jgi:hypothetical protein
MGIAHHRVRPSADGHAEHLDGEAGVSPGGTAEAEAPSRPRSLGRRGHRRETSLLPPALSRDCRNAALLTIGGWTGFYLWANLAAVAIATQTRRMVRARHRMVFARFTGLCGLAACNAQQHLEATRFGDAASLLSRDGAANPPAHRQSRAFAGARVHRPHRARS